MTDDIQTLFASACYRVTLPSGFADLRIDAPCPDTLACWLARHAGSTPAWLITAHNPRAQLLDASVNRARATVLEHYATTRHLVALECVNQDPADAWPDEPGLLIAGLEEGMARALGRRFAQLAIVEVRIAQSVRLLWL
ncbi:DUF3293 domain-containing protein [Salinisphaera aquimarina]|uniref:DUF3293 domain-containing protein n=1 Tax=Salinisphaera aquimarina TaxID=2094031 RepID=A0ABV7EU58_9GAMM